MGRVAFLGGGPGGGDDQLSSMATFFRLLDAEDKGEALRAAIAKMNGGEAEEHTYEADPASFRLIPGSPFAYWVSDSLRRKFRELPPFEGDGRTVRVGLQTSDDFRFVRAWWEVPPERILYVPAKAEELNDPERLCRYQEACREATRRGRYWVPFAKGGEYSPYYADLHLVVNWRDDGMEIRNFVGPNGRLASRPQNTDYYFRPGLTWPASTVKGFNVRVMPAGCIFAHKGPAAFFPTEDVGNRQRLAVLGIMNSELFSFLLLLQTASRAWEVGLVQQTPLPRLAHDETSRFATAVEAIYTDIKSLDQCDEVSRLFIRPFFHDALGVTLRAMAGAWVAEAQQRSSQVNARKTSLSLMALDAYGVEGPDRGRVLHGVSISDEVPEQTRDPDTDEGEDDGRLEARDGTVSAVEWAGRLLSYAVGCVFGRWDVRIGKGEKEPPPLPGPFDPLLPCSPGMLVGPDGLPARETPPGYPITIQWDGILVDDPGHPADIVARVREVLGYLFADGDPAAVEEEACAILGVRDLRTWFRQEFFPYHVKMYSKRPRKAPIYWQLCSERKSYSVWLYYHRLNHDTLYTVLRSYVERKIAYEEQRLREMQERLAAARAQGQRREERDLERQIEAQERLLEELGRFRDRIRAVADMGHEPDLDDGVLLNIAPLHQVVPWREAEKAWRELVSGKYPWASIAKSISSARRTSRR